MKQNPLNGYRMVDPRLGAATISGASGMFVSFEVNTGEQRRRVTPIKAN
jgi:hypothetical protein